MHKEVGHWSGASRLFYYSGAIGYEGYVILPYVRFGDINEGCAMVRKVSMIYEWDGEMNG